MNQRFALLALLTVGCAPLLGGRCAEGWTPAPGACDADGSLAVVDAVDARRDASAVADAAGAPDADAPGPDAPDAAAPSDGSADAPTADLAGPDAVAADAAAADSLVGDAPAVDAVTADAVPVDAAPSDAAGGDALDAGAADDDAADAPAGEVAPEDVRCPPGLTRCGGACVDTATSRLHCGACGAGCGPEDVCSAGECRPACEAPLRLCSGSCFDLATDPLNCGACGATCSSGICNGARCRDARPGHLVLIGHDYQTTRVDQNRVVGNAVFLSAAAAPRVATCAIGAMAASVASVRDAVRQVAGLRSWHEVVVDTPEALPQVFSVDTTDVVIVHHQPAATDAAIDALALRIAGPAVGFLRAGGVVIVLDGEGSSRGTWPVADATGLLTVTGREVVTFSATEVVAGGDAVAIGLPLAYRAERGSVAFTGSDGDGVVIRAGLLPLVLHRVVFAR